MSETVPTVAVTLVNRGLGGIHVHKWHCQDAKHDVRSAAVWDVEVASYVDVVMAIYPPDDFGYEPSEWRQYDGDVYIMPCCPVLATIVPPEV